MCAVLRHSCQPIRGEHSQSPRSKSWWKAVKLIMWSCLWADEIWVIVIPQLEKNICCSSITVAQRTKLFVVEHFLLVSLSPCGCVSSSCHLSVVSRALSWSHCRPRRCRSGQRYPPSESWMGPRDRSMSPLSPAERQKCHQDATQKKNDNNPACDTKAIRLTGRAPVRHTVFLHVTDAVRVLQ